MSSTPVSTGYPDLDALQPRLEAIPTLSADGLEAEHTAVLGRKSGLLTAALKTLAALPVEDRKRYGAAVNQVKARFEAAFTARRDRLADERRRRESVGLDLTMPGRERWAGAEHPGQRLARHQAHRRHQGLGAPVFFLLLLGVVAHRSVRGAPRPRRRAPATARPQPARPDRRVRILGRRRGRRSRYRVP